MKTPTEQLYAKCLRIARAGAFDEDSFQDAFLALLTGRAERTDEGVMAIYRTLRGKRVSAGYETVPSEDGFMETREVPEPDEWRGVRNAWWEVARFARWTLTDAEMLVFELRFAERMPLTSTAETLCIPPRRAKERADSAIAKLLFHFGAGGPNPRPETHRIFRKYSGINNKKS